MPRLLIDDKEERNEEMHFSYGNVLINIIITGYFLMSHSVQMSSMILDVFKHRLQNIDGRQFRDNQKEAGISNL